MGNAADENWRVLRSLFPRGWDRLAFSQGAVERLRGFPNTESLLRTLLLHVGRGYSLRETAVQAELAGLAEVSDVTILNRLRQAGGWLHRMCQELLHEMGMTLPMPPSGRNVRLLDGTLIQEPGRTGSSWRIHYSLQIPSVRCDHFEVTSTKGAGTGETLRRFPAAPGDLVLADRGFCKPDGIAGLYRQGADLIVRVNTGSLSLRTPEQKRFPLLERLRRLEQPGEIGEWQVHLPDAEGSPIVGRLCAVRKSQEAIGKAHRRIHRKAQQGGPQTKPETLAFACYVVVFTTLTATDFPAAQVLEWYRLRWQVELVFKRLKQLAGLGHLPKSQDDSSRAWLYGKLFVALLTQKLIYTGRAISPWGYDLPAPPSD
jgi:hypothetical protein